MSFIQSLTRNLGKVYPQAKRWLYKFHGGVFPNYNKELSSRNPLRGCFIPKELVLPLSPSVGLNAEPLVAVGDVVQGNQLIAQSKESHEKKLVVPIHAPTSGKIIAIEERALPHASGLQGLCIIIQPDGVHTQLENVLNSDKVWPDEPEQLKNLLAHSGVIGMGGAGFPTYAKLPKQKGKIRQLLINGAECEPFITCDDLLMQTHPEEILLGAQIVAKALGCELIKFGIESNKQTAIKKTKNAVSTIANQLVCPTEIQSVPTVYPMGGQKQLTYELTGVELESGGHAVDQGILMMNVATLRAIYRAVEFGEPLTSRFVTVSGLGLKKGFNIDALIGTPIEELAELAQPKFALTYPLVLGGPMMGVKMPSNQVPVLKTTNCILANPPEQKEMQMPCIRCGECMDACPVNLLPQQMYWHAQGHEYEKVEKLNVFDCIECGCCSFVCPSHIPLVQYYRHSKSEIRAINAENQATELAKQRHEFKLARIEREKLEREAKLKAKKEAVKKQADSETKSAAKAAPGAAAAAARAAAARKAAAKQSGEDSSAMSAREKAILSAQKAAANKQGQTDNDKKTKGQSLATAKDKSVAADAAKKRAAAAAAAARAAKAKKQKDAGESRETTEAKTEKPTMSARYRAVAAAKAAAEKKAQQAKTAESSEQHSANEEMATPSEKLTARDRAVAAAKAAAAARAKKTKQEVKSEIQTTDLTQNSPESSPALDKENARKAAMQKAREASLARKKAQQTAKSENVKKPLKKTESTETSDSTETETAVMDKKTAARNAAMAAAKKAAAKRAAAKSIQNEQQHPANSKEEEK